MNIDFTPFFDKYEKFRAKADNAFAKVAKEYPECIKCKIKCADCCYALFDLSLIEALYINHQFHKHFKGKEKEELLEKANSTDRKIYSIKRKAYKDLQAGRDENEIMAEIAQDRVRCPLLNTQDECDLYEHRPITCRFYGIPTSIGGKGHTCGKSGFVEGNQYPTVNLDIIFRELYTISDELAKAIKSKYLKISDMLVPLSMALLTSYDEEYLGVKKDEG